MKTNRIVLPKSNGLMSVTIFAIMFALSFFTLIGCGGGGNDNNSVPERAQTPVTVGLNWAGRTRSLSGPASALSAVLILRGAAPTGGDFTFAPAINRDASRLESHSVSLTSTNNAFAGTWPLRVEFHAQANGEGDVVGVVDASVTIAADGTGIADLATSGTVASVTIDPNQKVLVGATKSVAFSVRDTSVPAKLLALTPGSASFAVVSGDDKLDVAPDGTASGFDTGTASVTATVDGKTSSAENIAVVYPGGGILRSISVAGNDGTNAPVTPVEGNLPAEGSLTAPDLSATVSTIVRGGSVILSIITSQPVDALLIGIGGQSDYYRLDVGTTGTRAIRNIGSGKVTHATPCGDAPCHSKTMLAEKYPVRDIIVSRSANRSNGRATGTEYQVVLSVPSDVSVADFRVNVQTVVGADSSLRSEQAVTVNQTAQSSGSLQFTLTWSQPVDLDLHVMTPTGRTIYFANRSDDTGGSLDLDSNAGCSIDNINNENITWSGEAPTGEYTIEPVLFASCGVATAIPYVVTVNDNGEIDTYRGIYDPSEVNRSVNKVVSKSRATARTIKHNRAKKRIVVNVARQKLFAYEVKNGTEEVVYTFDCVTGRIGYETEPGTHKVAWKKVIHHSREYNNAPMPYTMMFNIDRGIAIHERKGARWDSYQKYLGIGNPGSHGCVGLPNGDAATLFEWTPEGTEVKIVAQ